MSVTKQLHLLGAPAKRSSLDSLDLTLNALLAEEKSSGN